jgi:hypothetical protein
LEFCDFEAKFLFQQRGGGAGGVYSMVGQERAVEFSPFHQIPFPIVMPNEGDLFIMPHYGFFVSHMNSLILCSFSLIFLKSIHKPAQKRHCRPNQGALAYFQPISLAF